MINLKTVLILGAGASKDFGFPTGRELVSWIINSFGNRTMRASQNLAAIAGEQKAEEAMKFANTLKLADPPSVDVWLEHNDDIEFIWVGKIIMAMALLAHERHSNLRPNNNWYQLLFDRLDAPFDKFQNNKLAIVTFNYDRSLEHYFFERFRNTNKRINEKECTEKINQLQILHIYGSLGRLEWQFDDPKNLIPQVPYGAEWTKDAIISAANSIEIMSEKSSGVGRRLEEFYKLMQDCQALYFLGFGYHDVNMQRLGIDTLKIPHKIMGTVQGLSYQRIREIENLNISTLRITNGLFGESIKGLFRESIYDFLHKFVHFNELKCPDQRVYQE